VFLFRIKICMQMLLQYYFSNSNWYRQPRSPSHPNKSKHKTNCKWFACIGSLAHSVSATNALALCSLVQHLVCLQFICDWPDWFLWSCKTSCFKDQSLISPGTNELSIVTLQQFDLTFTCCYILCFLHEEVTLVHLVFPTWHCLPPINTGTLHMCMWRYILRM